LIVVRQSDRWNGALFIAWKPREGLAICQNEPDLMATGFGPECHLDETNPNYQAKAVI
jgi:hypothetical protein